MNILKRKYFSNGACEVIVRCYTISVAGLTTETGKTFDVSQRLQAFVCFDTYRNHLPISLYTKVANIPPEGYTLTEIERSCDRNEKFCKTPLHVWECECPVCHGTGNVSYDRPKKTRILSVCPVCSGLGVVRYISADVEGEDFSQFKTLLRKSNGIM